MNSDLAYILLTGNYQEKCNWENTCSLLFLRPVFFFWDSSYVFKFLLENMSTSTRNRCILCQRTLAVFTSRTFPRDFKLPSWSSSNKEPNVYSAPVLPVRWSDGKPRPKGHPGSEQPFSDSPQTEGDFTLSALQKSLRLHFLDCKLVVLCFNIPLYVREDPLPLQHYTWNEVSLELVQISGSSMQDLLWPKWLYVINKV